jgi:hypothetical protein
MSFGSHCDISLPDIGCLRLLLTQIHRKVTRCQAFFPERIGSAGQGNEQVADFLVDLIFGGNRLGDLIPQQFAVAPPKAMCGDSSRKDWRFRLR